jgi:hypothetical protein
MRKVMVMGDEFLANAKYSSGLLKNAPKDGGGVAGEAASNLINSAKGTRAWGIASAGVAKYMKVRTTVRYAYEEIQLWKGVIQEYKNLKRFFKEFGRSVADVGKDSFGLFVKGEGRGIEEKLRRVVDITDNLQDLKNMPKTLNARLMAVENAWDDFAQEEFTYSIGLWSATIHTTPGVLIPKTGAVFDTIGGLAAFDNKYMDWVADRTNPGWREKSGSLSDDQQTGSGTDGKKGFVIGDLNKSKLEIGRGQEIVGDDPLRVYTSPIISNEIVMANAVARSNVYLMWAQRGMMKMDELDSKLSKVVKEDSSQGGVNGLEFAATWYAIETVNAKNKLLRHAIEESKLLTAAVGTDLHEKVATRHQQLDHAIDSKKFADAFK